MKAVIRFLKEVEDVAEKYPRLQVKAQAIRWDFESAISAAQKHKEENLNSAHETKDVDKTDTQQLKDSISLLNEAVNVQDCTCTLKTEPCWMCRALEQIAKLESI